MVGMDQSTLVESELFPEFFKLDFTRYYETMDNMINKYVILRMGVHDRNGSPVSPWGQIHMGLWFMTEHWALKPHVPGHGSLHFWLMQASFCAQSELIVHSGRHEGGLPIYPWTHLHIAMPLTSWQWLLGPHGDGEQGFVTISADKKKLNPIREFFRGCCLFLCVNTHCCRRFNTTFGSCFFVHYTHKFLTNRKIRCRLQQCAFLQIFTGLLIGSYLPPANIERKSFLAFLADSCTLVYDSLSRTVRSNHKYRCTDLYICYGCKLYHESNHRWQRILVGIRCKDRHDILAYRSNCRLDI